MNDDGFAFFMFENKDCYRNILDGGPWNVGGFFVDPKKMASYDEVV